MAVAPTEQAPPQCATPTNSALSAPYGAGGPTLNPTKIKEVKTMSKEKMIKSIRELTSLGDGS
ncbi:MULTISPECIES: hypothetical protein [unclassified Streptomyces]|uniref:hypothetical protein n=1 Tax=unclassified Streptomyces TaxID=2593676 RepID=UPI002257D689|nr:MULTISPECIES: hypothetical protein [unclassified Streptomyces]MCX4406093.1 hypothetical protein [Streptomyces sp. NBC_01764]MCX5189382.1 hypothetical protein [Streptomyces sp. NBC_00268]